MVFWPQVTQLLLDPTLIRGIFPELEQSLLVLRSNISLRSSYLSHCIQIGQAHVFDIGFRQTIHALLHTIGENTCDTQHLSASLPLAAAIPLMIILTVLLGFIIERAAYKPLRTAPRMSVMISAIGVSYLLQNLATYVTGGLPQMYPALPGLSNQLTIAGVSTKYVTVVTPVLVVLLVAALTQLINHTRIGMAMRAVSRDFETAQLMGIRINSVISVTFIIGSLLAAIGSLLYFTNYQSIVPLSGSLPGLRAFVAAVFGGIGSIPGAVVGAFLIGICESVIKGSDWSVFSDAFTFAILIVVLCVKPTGLFGEKVTDKV